MLDYNDKKLHELLAEKPFPSYRQAYSDRRAWLMACLSQLVYEDFGSVDEKITKKFLQEKLDKYLGEHAKDTFKKEALKQLEIAGQKIDATESLSSKLQDYGCEIKETYDHDGTQAILVSTDNYLALSFRGTERDFKNIKADLKATLKPCETGGKIHSGFEKAFKIVKNRIQSDLNNEKYAAKPLLITGHGLGGALATIAAKQLKHKGGIAACYTFGAPRVGDKNWSYNIKTPIYRVVNAADIVTMLPPSGEFISLSMWACKVLGKILPPVKLIYEFLRKFENYFHVGFVRHLTSCEAGKYEKVKLTYSVSFWRRVHTAYGRLIFKKLVADHSIGIYRQKLAIIALRNNKQ